MKKAKRVHPSKMDKRSKEYKAWNQRKIARAAHVETPKTKSTRAQDLVKSEALRLYKTATKFTDHEIGHQLGLSGSSVSAYLRKGEMPKIVEIALHGLTGAKKPIVVTVLFDSETEASAMTTVLDRMGVSYATQNATRIN